MVGKVKQEQLRAQAGAIRGIGDTDADTDEIAIQNPHNANADPPRSLHAR